MSVCCFSEQGSLPASSVTNSFNAVRFSFLLQCIKYFIVEIWQRH